MRAYYEQDGITIYHGDARELLGLLPHEPQVWVFDPPYSSGGFQEAGKSSGSIGKMGATTSDDAIQFDRLSTRGYSLMMRDVLRHARQCSELCVFTDWRMWTTTTDAIEYAGFQVRAMVVWAKPKNGIGRPWLNCHELVAFGMRGSADKDRPGTANVIDCGRSRNALHPTEKPLELMAKIVKNLAPGVVVDPFAGSGTTLLAAKNLGRKAVGFEIEERHCETAAQRLSQQVLDFGEAA